MSAVKHAKVRNVLIFFYKTNFIRKLGSEIVLIKITEEYFRLKIVQKVFSDKKSIWISNSIFQLNYFVLQWHQKLGTGIGSRKIWLVELDVAAAELY